MSEEFDDYMNIVMGDDIEEAVKMWDNKYIAMSNNWNGLNVLHYASLYGFTKLVTFFLQKGMQVNAVDDEGESPLHHAANNNNVETVVLLLQNGADSNLMNKDGKTPIQLAEEKKYDKCTSILREDGFTPLHLASERNYDKLADILLKNGADPNYADKDGFTPLHLVSEKNYDKVADILLKNGADPNYADKNGFTPLHLVSEKNYDKVADILLKNGADPNYADKDGFTPLHLVSKKNYDKVADILLKNGADPNYADKDGSSPLHHAVRNNNVEIVVLLLQKSADPNVADKMGKTAIQLAEEYKYDKCLSILTEMGKTAIHLAEEEKIDKCVSTLTECTPIPKDDDDDGFQYDIFLSYSWKNKTFVDKIYKTLQKKYKIWRDKETIVPGEMLLPTIVSGIDNSRIFVAAISAAYQNSNITQKEFLYAQERNKQIIPICVEKDYRPQNWLSFAMGNMLRIKYPTDDNEAYTVYINEIEKCIKMNKIKTTNQK